MGAAGIIQADLARAAHVSEATISLIRRKGHIPSADIVRALAEALEADVDSALEALGHETLEMIRTYTRIAEADLVAAHRSASPVENWRL
jgi:transcriptional regulator with XRE-family HTH domain